MSTAGKKFSVVIPAGKRPGVDPVAEAAGTPLKALAEIAGAPMITRVVRAVCASHFVGELVIAADQAMPDFSEIKGLAEAFGDIPVTRVETAATISQSVQHAIAATNRQNPAFITTCDHALLTTEIVDDFLGKATNRGVCVGFVSRATIERAYPEMKRTYLPFSDVAVSGANLFALVGDEALAAIRFWETVEANRKSPLKIIAAFGPANLIAFKLGLLSLEGAFKRAGQIIGCEASPILLNDPHAAIDVDKVSDLETVEKILATR